MSNIRVLVIDDAVVVRKVLSDAINEAPGLEVIATASNGKIGLSKLSQQQPDVVILDIEMPEMDGLTTLTEIRKLYPKLPVIMYSTLTERGAMATLDALERGASDYVAKPSNAGSMEMAKQVINEELIPKIKALAGTPAASPAEAPAARPAPRVVPAAPPSGPRRVDVVAIGASTGGPNALPEVVTHFGADFPVPVVCVQHMPPLFTKMFADRLNRNTALEVHEAEDGDAVRSGRMAVAPGDFHMITKRQGTDILLRLHQGPQVNSCRPAVDVLFQSVAEIYGPHVLGVVLTGMGQDGLRGCEVIRANGGQVVVQDEATSTVWGMPGFVAKAGLADEVLPLDAIGAKIVQLCKAGRTLRAA